MPSLGQFGIDRIESLMWRRRGSSAGGITVMWVVWGVTRRVWVRGGCWCGCSLSCFSCRRAGENVRQNSSIYVSKRVVFNAFSTHRGSGRVVKASRSKSLSIEVRDPVLGRRFESCLSRNHFFFFASSRASAGDARGRPVAPCNPRCRLQADNHLLLIALPTSKFPGTLSLPHQNESPQPKGKANPDLSKTSKLPGALPWLPHHKPPQ